VTPPAAALTGWVVDASVALKWFLPVDREPDGALARSAIERLTMVTTALAIHEVGNVLTRRSGWTADQIAAALGLLLEICGEPVNLTVDDHRAAAHLALEHDLTFYDSSYAVIARRVGRKLLSAERDLLDPGLAVDLRGALG
jgi:predicted nucleic acid-binding protein